jgi:hypothetical protein
MSRKEIADHFERDRVTVYRWERDGLKLVDGRGTVGEVAWFLELRDSAKTLRIDPRKVVLLPRDDQVRLIARALEVRTEVAAPGTRGRPAIGRADATSCNIADQDTAHATR